MSPQPKILKILDEERKLLLLTLHLLTTSGKYLKANMGAIFLGIITTDMQNLKQIDIYRNWTQYFKGSIFLSILM